MGGDAWTFTGQAGPEVVITLDATNDGPLDPYLVLLGQNGGIISENDDGGGELHSRISMILPESGQYLIFARGYASRSGDYILMLGHPDTVQLRRNLPWASL